jgi:hypothetical protein
MFSSPSKSETNENKKQISDEKSSDFVLPICSLTLPKGVRCITYSYLTTLELLDVVSFLSK